MQDEQGKAPTAEYQVIKQSAQCMNFIVVKQYSANYSQWLIIATGWLLNSTLESMQIKSEAWVRNKDMTLIT